MKFLENPQIYQTSILSLILFIGVYFFNLNISFLEICIVFFTVGITDFLIKNNFTISKESIFPYSGINAAFGICFFLRSDDLIIYFFAAFLAIAGKHIIQIRGRHFLNPSNMAVFITVCLLPQYAWINSLQWGNYIGSPQISYIIMLAFVILLGISVALKVGSLLSRKYLFDYIGVFILAHFILYFIIPFDESISSFFVFFNISFFIFVFFMITDPKTIPEKSFSRSLYAIMIVLWFYILQFHINEGFAILGSLFVSTFHLPAIWKYERILVRNINIGYAGLCLYLIFLSFCILAHIQAYGQPDLTFDNACSQLVCK